MTRFFRKIHGSSCESEDHSAKRGTIILAEETLYGPSVEEIKMRRRVLRVCLVGVRSTERLTKYATL